MANPVQQARKYDRQINGHTANPNATPVGSRGSRNGGGQAPAWAPANPRTQMPAQSPLTPGLNRLPSTNPNATQDSNRSGAFGSGAQNLQARRDLYAKMGADKGWQDNPAYRAQAQALGVTDKGWANAANRLAGFGGPAAEPKAGVSTQPDTTEIRNKVAANIQQPELPPGQTPAWAQVGPPAPPPLTQGQILNRTTTPQQASESTRAAINVGKTPASSPAPAAAPSAPAAPAAPAPTTPAPRSTTPPPDPADTLPGGSGNDAIQNGNSPDRPITANVTTGIGAASAAIRGGANAAAKGIYTKSAQALTGASRALSQADRAEKLAQVSNVARNTSKTGSAARATFKAAEAAQEGIAASRMGTAASLTRTGDALGKVGNAVQKAGKVASLGKFGAAAGKAAPWAQVAQGVYEGGMAVGSASHRQKRKSELESAVSGSKNVSGRGAVEGALNPVGTIIAAGGHAKDAWDSSARAAASQTALNAAMPRHEKVKAFRAQIGSEKLAQMSPKERIAAMKAAGL